MVPLRPQVATELNQSYLKQLRREINDALISLPIPKHPAYLYDPLTYVFSGKGKRLRPILLHITGEAFGVSTHDLHYAGIAVELLHNFTLVHDDIMDQDDLRHGKYTIHKKWDESTAILAGDGIYVLSLSLISKVKSHPLKVVKTFNEAALNVCEGQAYDKQYEFLDNITVDEYLVMVKKKTGHLIGLCTELGGILGNQQIQIIKALKKFGTLLGTAFQIQDDLLEITANEDDMGKSLGSDLTKGKQTVLSILARQKNALEWKKLNTKKGNITDRIREQKQFFKANGIFEEAENMIQSFINDAREILNSIPDPCRTKLNQFTKLILERDH